MMTLKNVLLINAVSSGVTGLAMIAVPGMIAELFEVSLKQPFIGVGLFLFVFAVSVFLVSKGNPISVKAVRMIIMLDSIWVGVSLFILVARVFEVSTIGNIMIGAVALWVSLMALLQYTGIRKYSVSENRQ